MTEFATPEGLEHVKYYKSPRDNRVVAIHIRAGFEEFESFPPFMDTEEEHEHIRKSYNVDPTSERRNKAHITDDNWPLQVIMLNRDPGGTTAAALDILMAEDGLTALMTRAILRATERSRELAG